ncbi:MAG: probable conjugal transfer protein (TrbE) [Leptospirillum rubarum]|nr:MAG: probable conjugal transfer protein (TrbE) [Leptospirillum rubarum]
MGTLRIDDLKDSRPGLESLLNWESLVAPGVLRNKDGSLLSAFEFSGPDLESSSSEELAATSARINAAFSKLGSGWMIHIDLLRLPSLDYLPEGNFPDSATRAIDSERRLQFEHADAHWLSRRVLAVTWSPPGETASKFGELFLKESGPRGPRTHFRQTLARFQSDVGRFSDLLSGGMTLKPLGDEDLLTHLHTCLTGKTHPVRVPRIPTDLDALLATGDLTGGLDPKIGRLWFRVVTISGFPESSFPGFLDALAQVPFAIRYSIRFIPLDPPTAERELARHRRRWLQLRMGLLGMMTGRDQASGAQTSASEKGLDVEMAQAENADGSVRFGYAAFKILIFDENPSVLAERVRMVEKIVNNLGFGTIHEEMNCLSAWIESLPGHAYPNIRKPLMHSLNVSDLMPVTTVWSGRSVNPCPFYPQGSPALFLASSSGTTPFFGNIHVGDLGHTLILGPPGMGKSVLMAFLAAQFFRYPRAQVFAFDKGSSSYVLCTASGGQFYEIAGPDSALSFCPLAGVDDPAERTWAQGWIESMLVLSGLTLTPAIKQEVKNALKTHADTPPDRRSLGVFVERIQHLDVREALRYYTKSGSMGELLDADTDSLRTSHFSVFEMEYAFGLPHAALLPLLLYLFHRIEQRLDGRPTLLLLDEVWLFLSHPVFQEKIREWLKVLRKKNAAVIFATQQPFDVVNSPIRDVILESCPTKIYLANPEAVAGPSHAAYATMGLSERSIEIIGSLVPKRHYYVTSSEGKRVIDLGLGKVALAFTGVSDQEELGVARRILKSGDISDFSARWLDHKNLPDWARHVRETSGKNV